MAKSGASVVLMEGVVGAPDRKGGPEKEIVIIGVHWTIVYTGAHTTFQEFTYIHF